MTNTETMIHSLVNFMDCISTKIADDKPIKAKCEEYYPYSTKTIVETLKRHYPFSQRVLNRFIKWEQNRYYLKREVIKLLTQNTGVSMLDSGGAYGRSWQKNREIEDWDNTPVYNYSAFGSGDTLEMSYTHSLYHYLIEVLEFDDKVLKLREIFDEYEKDPENKGLYWDDLMENFIEKNGELLDSYNTYNSEYDILTQILQYKIFEYEGETYVFLQVHGGCDIRGGYTDPVIFKTNDEEYLGRTEYMDDIEWFCTECGQRWTHDAWEKHYPIIKTEPGQIDLNGEKLPNEYVDRSLKANNKGIVIKDYKPYCECGGKIEHRYI